MSNFILYAASLWALVLVGCFNKRPIVQTKSEQIVINIKDSGVREYFVELKKDLTDSIKDFILTKRGPYYISKFDDSTKITIDTILSNQKKTKISFFVITENSNQKLIYDKKNNGIHFDAHCFLGKKTKNHKLEIIWISALNLTRYKTLNEASRRIRELYFLELNKIKDINGGSQYIYNLNDDSFWEKSPLWSEFPSCP